MVVFLLDLLDVPQPVVSHDIIGLPKAHRLHAIVFQSQESKPVAVVSLIIDYLRLHGLIHICLVVFEHESPSLANQLTEGCVDRHEGVLDLLSLSDILGIDVFLVSVERLCFAKLSLFEPLQAFFWVIDVMSRGLDRF